MSVQEERPPGGGDWLGNARIFERSRVSCLNEAEKLERDGHPEEAARLRECAATAKRDRDRDQREMERRAMNRSINAQRRWR